MLSRGRRMKRGLGRLMRGTGRIVG